MHMLHERATTIPNTRIAPEHPFEQRLKLQAVLLAGDEPPALHKRAILVPAGRLVGAAVPAATPASGWDDMTPGLHPFTPVARILPEPTFSSPDMLRSALISREDELLNALWARAGFAEQRILLTTQGHGVDETCLTGTQARLVAALAETVREVAHKVCLTPPSLAVPAHGSVHMALSLMVEQSQLAQTDHALELAGRMMREHGMTLTITAPGPVESFPVRGFC